MDILELNWANSILDDDDDDDDNHDNHDDDDDDDNHDNHDDNNKLYLVVFNYTNGKIWNI